jgi:hypothetical protein
MIDSLRPKIHLSIAYSSGLCGQVKKRIDSFLQPILGRLFHRDGAFAFHSGLLKCFLQLMESSRNIHYIHDEIRVRDFKEGESLDRLFGILNVTADIRTYFIQLAVGPRFSDKTTNRICAGKNGLDSLEPLKLLQLSSPVLCALRRDLLSSRNDDGYRDSKDRGDRLEPRGRVGRSDPFLEHCGPEADHEEHHNDERGNHQSPVPNTEFLHTPPLNFGGILACHPKETYQALPLARKP